MSCTDLESHGGSVFLIGRPVFGVDQGPTRGIKIRKIERGGNGWRFRFDPGEDEFGRVRKYGSIDLGAPGYYEFGA